MKYLESLELSVRFSGALDTCGAVFSTGKEIPEISIYKTIPILLGIVRKDSSGEKALYRSSLIHLRSSKA